MSIKKIPCGGFSYDDTEIAFEDGVIHPIAGGGGDDVIFTYDEDDNIHCNKTFDEVHSMSTMRASFDDGIPVVRNYNSDEQMLFFSIFDASFNYNADTHFATSDANLSITTITWNRGEDLKWGDFVGTIAMNS